MTWHFWAALVAGLVVAILADWLFAGVLFHDRSLGWPVKLAGVAAVAVVLL